MTDNELTVKCMNVLMDSVGPVDAETGSAIGTGGGEVKFENAETNWVKNAEGGYDLLLRFTEGGSYTLPGLTKARILAVGGGRNMV